MIKEMLKNKNKITNNKYILNKLLHILYYSKIYI